MRAIKLGATGVLAAIALWASGALMFVDRGGAAELPNPSNGAATHSGVRGLANRRRAGPRVLHVAGYTLTVTNLERSLAFYRDVLGLPLETPPGTAAANRANEQLTDTPGAQLRSAVLRLPGSHAQLLLEQFTGIERRAFRPQVVDPGAVALRLQVRDLAPVLTAAQNQGVRIITPGAEPLRFDGQTAIALSDPDGLYVEVEQDATAKPTLRQELAGTYVAEDENVVHAGVAYTVAEPVPVTRFYGGVLGMTVIAGRFTLDRAFDELMNAPRALSDSMSVVPADRPGRSLQFVAFRGVKRHTYLLRPQDPGACSVSVLVSNLTDTIRRIRASGATIVSAGGQPALTASGAGAILVRDPAGVLLQIAQRR